MPNNPKAGFFPLAEIETAIRCPHCGSDLEDDGSYAKIIAGPITCERCRTVFIAPRVVVTWPKTPDEEAEEVLDAMSGEKPPEAMA